MYPWVLWLSSHWEPELSHFTKWNRRDQAQQPNNLDPSGRHHARTMPTLNIAEPLAPGQTRTPSECVAFGRIQWQLKWKRFAAQWTQPQLMKLAAATLGEAAVHSSQIRGFATGQLRDPAPKVLLAIGQLNAAIAHANGVGPGLNEHEPTCPETLGELWSEKRCITDAQGAPLDAIGCFMAFTGQLDLGVVGAVRSGVLNSQSMPAVSKHFGKVLRVRLMQNEVDFMDPTWLQSLDGFPTEIIEKLIYGKELDAFELEENLDAIATLVGMDPVELWDDAVTPAMNGN